MIELVNRNIGKFILDGTQNENNKSNLRITKNPVESGANVADHAILEPKQITIKGHIVAYEPPSAQTGWDKALQKVKMNLPRIKTAHKLTQRALKLKAQVEHLKNTVDEYLDIFGLGSTDQILAPFLPDFLKQDKDNTQGLNRIQGIYAKLLSLQRNGEVLEVQTGVMLYKNMMITAIEATTESDLWLDVTISLEELFIVETKTASGLKIPGKSKTNMGKTQLEKPQSLLDKIRKAL